jgi:hypothetical protein
VIEPEGRTVEITEKAWRHVCDHGEMTTHFDQIKETISHPAHIEDDVRPGRVRYYRQGIGPTRWLRVVISYEDDPTIGRLVTAFGHSNDP